ncbi:MAG: ankyrin repeat domain-containing protein [Acidobacteriaceae bacterium]|nr:ankyrin repeat domain-containing protein [Acidobacteriaceae bacterium]MBV9779989.1 ankyrin repeat domain-containing protein [Acidobacteriaceae bacterium]
MDVFPAALLAASLFLAANNDQRLETSGTVEPAIEESSATADALTAAVRAGRLDKIEQLIRSGADLNARDRVGSTALHAVAISGDAEIAHFLLAHGAKIDALQGVTGATPLECAALSGKTQVTKLLLEAGARVDLRDKAGETVLHLAAARGNAELLDLLIGHCRDVDMPDASGESALDEAVSERQPGIVSILIAHRANPNRVHQPGGRTVLDEACIKGFAELIEPLIAGGADPNWRDQSGQSPLDLALAYKNANAVVILLQLAKRNSELQRAAENAMESATLRGQTETASLLIQSGFDIDKPTPSGSTYLHDASLNGREKMVRLLLERGARLDARDRNGATPLHEAALAGSVGVIRVLLDRGAYVDALENDSGATPLMLAASLGRTDAVAVLLSRGANSELRDRAGRSALDRAKENDDARTLKLLETSARSKIAHSAKAAS